jgi:arylsulfatase A-like enzyme
MTTDDRSPNIIIILADDMGYSDLGCFGSEIATPNLDALASSGLRFSQMYNSARCCPSRAALLTGVHPHQAGVGHMVSDLGRPEYQGYLRDNVVTIAEALKSAGYRTLMSGKWHVGGDYNVTAREDWNPGGPGFPVPTQRGFDRYFGILSGGGSYFFPKTLAEQDTLLEPDLEGFYLTDAISDSAVDMIEDATAGEDPFFMYVAYTAPHWPLHALEEDIARYEGKYRNGWDHLRTGRHEQLKGMGILDEKWDISPRDDDSPPWDEAADHDWEDIRMAVYSAQIDRLDQGVGKIVSALRRAGADSNTIVMFLSDNGGCAEFLAEESSQPQPHRYMGPNPDGTPLVLGNIRELRPGGAQTFMSYDLPWANASNTPFRRFKRWTHEGGISTPFILSWPDRIREPGIVHSPTHLIDIMPTCLQAAGASQPTEREGQQTLPLEGESFLSAIDRGEWSREQPIFWEHEGSRAIRQGQWKLVSAIGGPWELYDMETDRTELNDLYQRNRNKAHELEGLYEEWADRCGVLPWSVINPDWNPIMHGESIHTSLRLR